MSTVAAFAASTNVAAATLTLTIPYQSGFIAYCSGFVITGGGATVGAIVTATLAGGPGGVTHGYSIAAPTGATVGLTPLVVQFDPPIPAKDGSTSIVLTVPSLGAGNTVCQGVLTGFYLPSTAADALPYQLPHP